MNSIHVFEAFTALSKKVREEKRIISHLEFENFVREYEIHQNKKDFIEEWWDFRFMKALRLIDLNTPETEYQEILKEYRSEKDRKRNEMKKNKSRETSKTKDSFIRKEDVNHENIELDKKNNDNHPEAGNISENFSDLDTNPESLKNRVSRLVDKLSGLL